LLLGDNTKAPHTNNPSATRSFSIGEKNRNKNKKQRITLTVGVSSQGTQALGDCNHLYHYIRVLSYHLQLRQQGLSLATYWVQTINISWIYGIRVTSFGILSHGPLFNVSH
jgi:hypothetical protein